MKKLNVTFDGTFDSTGYLFSLMKCLSASLRSSIYKDYADDVVAASGFAFRMWADEKTLCPSATSIWDFSKQKEWVENSGLICDYTERLWHEGDVEAERRTAAVNMIISSIDRGFAPVAWDISGCEWGIIKGYDESDEIFYTLKLNGSEGILPYTSLGKLEIPILSVLTVTGRREKPADELVASTKKLALSHLKGDEWCDNAKGIAVYKTLTDFTENKLTEENMWNLEYMLGTYAALKYYGWNFFEKYGETELRSLYENIYKLWSEAFSLVNNFSGDAQSIKAELAELLKNAENCEKQAMEIL